MLTALGSIATQHANPTKNTMEKVRQLLDYAATRPDAIITYLGVGTPSPHIQWIQVKSLTGLATFMSQQ